MKDNELDNWFYMEIVTESYWHVNAISKTPTRTFALPDGFWVADWEVMPPKSKGSVPATRIRNYNLVWSGPLQRLVAIYY